MMSSSTTAVAALLLILLLFAAQDRVESFTARASVPPASAVDNPNPRSFGSCTGSDEEGWARQVQGSSRYSRRLAAGRRSDRYRYRSRASFSLLHDSPSRQVDYHPRMGELTPPEARVYQLLHDLHDAGFAFRVVVVGRGSIAEFTVPRLGPRLSISQSPSSGANLLTLSSADASWEYHVQLSDVFKVALVEKATPAKTLRIVRLVGSTGDTLSSLILVPDHPGHTEGEEEAIRWFHGLVEKYGSEMQL